MARAAQISMMSRNPNTNPRLIEARSAATVPGSRSGGTGRAASLISFDCKLHFTTSPADADVASLDFGSSYS
jgi:hypothetical protein